MASQTFVGLTQRFLLHNQRTRLYFSEYFNLTGLLIARKRYAVRKLIYFYVKKLARSHIELMKTTLRRELTRQVLSAERIRSGVRIFTS